jgi:hypothetical protein
MADIELRRRLSESTRAFNIAMRGIPDNLETTGRQQ